MEPRSYVTFDWAVADDEKVDPSGEVVPGGKSIMETIRSALCERGYHVSLVEPHDSYGWCFYTEFQGECVWSMLQRSDTWLLISKVWLSWIQKLRGHDPNPAIAQASQALHECLSGLSLARGIRWFTREEFERGKGEGGAHGP